MKLNSLNRDLTNGDKSLSNSYLSHIVELLRSEVANLTEKENALEEITKEHIETQKEVVDTKTEETTLLLLNHINSEKRDSLNGHSPYEVSRILLDNRLHTALGLVEIPADEVTLIPALLK